MQPIPSWKLRSRQVDGLSKADTIRMTFDDQLKRAFDALTDGVRDELSRHARSALDELTASARADRDLAVAAARTEAGRAASETLASAVAEAEARGRASARVEYERDHAEPAGHNRQDPRELAVEATAAADAAIGHLAEAVRTIDRAYSLTEILDTLVSCAGREAARAGLFLVRGGSFHGSRFSGFDPGVDGSPAFEIDAEEGGILTAALRGDGQTGGSAASGPAPSFAELPSGSEAVAVPVAMNGEVVAVLYADEGGANRRLPADTIELLARHSGRCLEALTAFRAARTVLDRPAAASAAPQSPACDEPGDEEGASARLYARLLVAEINLYHGAAVVAGRRERDLATRLDGEITRARVLYERRVPEHLREHKDYFQNELVRSLANGDPALLELRI
jgi:hypothetical protein